MPTTRRATVAKNIQTQRRGDSSGFHGLASATSFHGLQRPGTKRRGNALGFHYGSDCANELGSNPVSASPSTNGLFLRPTVALPHGSGFFGHLTMGRCHGAGIFGGLA